LTRFIKDQRSAGKMLGTRKEAMQVMRRTCTKSWLRHWLQIHWVELAELN